MFNLTMTKTRGVGWGTLTRLQHYCTYKIDEHVQFIYITLLFLIITMPNVMSTILNKYDISNNSHILLVTHTVGGWSDSSTNGWKVGLEGGGAITACPALNF